VGDPPNYDNMHLHITGPGEKGVYITLSHRWGNSKSFKTTMTNLEEFRKGIDLNMLPNLFKDVVVVTQKLGTKYLWIDSLCIIQDGDGLVDWRNQSGHMEEIFASAYCTIAATSASGSCEGFLVSRANNSSIMISDVDQSDLLVYVSPFDDNFRHDVEEGDLNKRAWVLQERALSPRTIHFTKGHTYWECGSVVRCDNLVQTVR
jgi:hypothetical protein